MSFNPGKPNSKAHPFKVLTVTGECSRWIKWCGNNGVSGAVDILNPCFHTSIFMIMRSDWNRGRRETNTEGGRTTGYLGHSCIFGL